MADAHHSLDPLISPVAREPSTTRAATISKLNSLSTRGGVYLTTRYGLSILVSLGNMFLLTRWIGPHAYGLFVTAVGLTTFLASLARFGVDTYLVRCEPAPTRRQYDVAFTLILINSVFLAGIGLACVPSLRRWYAGDEFMAPYLVLLLTVPLTGVAGLPMAKLERALNFRTIAGIELGGQVLALFAAAILAWHGAGVWAPVAGLFCWQIFALLAACLAARFSPVLDMCASDARQMLTFGFGFAASIRMWQLRSLVNPLLVGRFGGAESVALVAFALRVGEGIGFTRTAAGRLAIAAFARLQSDRTNLKKALERALELQVLVLGPLLCLFALCGPWLVPRMMGARWLGVLTVFPFVAIGVLLSSIFNLQASALFVVGEQWAVLRAYAFHVVLLSLTTLLLLPRLGIVAYGWGEIVACGGYVFIHSAISRVTPLSYRRIVPWVILFVVLPGMATGWLGLTAILALLTLTMLVAATPHFVHPCTTLQTFSRIGRTIAVARRRAHTFAAKARLRGWSYIAAVARFQLASGIYRARCSAKSMRALAQACGVQAGSRETGKRHANVVPIATSRAVARFQFGEDDIPVIVARIPDRLKKKTIAEADSILAGRFRFRGEDHAFPGEVNWDFSPGGNLSWQWDFNRHRFFLDLAAAHYYTGDHRYMAELVQLWRHWIVSNPVAQGKNWKYPFEVAARLQNWMWTYFFLLYSSARASVDFTQLENALHEHALYVAHHLEYHWPNNHLLLEAKALYEFALLLPHLDAGGKFRDRSRRVLESQVLEQVLADGCHSELCSMYHRILAGELGELLILCERLGIGLAEPVVSRIKQMNLFSQAMHRADGSLALLGDSAAEDTYLRFELANAGYSDLNYWLCPDIGAPTRAEVVENTEMEVFPDGGYAFLESRVEETHVTFDFGNFSRCKSPNHGHSDALSFELWAKGQPIVVDPGVYMPWNDGAAWTRHFRSTAAHNTLQIDDKSQSDLSRWCDVRKSASCRLVRQVNWSDSAAITAECIPYWSNGENGRHTREICLRAGQLNVWDRVEGTGVYPLSWSFQFAPELDLIHENGMLCGQAGGQRLFSLAIHSREQLPLELFYGHKNPLRGWISRDCYQVVPAPLAHFSIKARLPFEAEFIFIL